MDILKQAIENEEKLVHEIVLLGTALSIRKVLRSDQSDRK